MISGVEAGALRHSYLFGHLPEDELRGCSEKGEFEQGQRHGEFGVRE